MSDGITIGHPRCAVANCTAALANKRNRYCPGHTYLEGYCSVEGCNEAVIENSLTCGEPEHLALYAKYQNRKGASFQRRTKSGKASKPPDEEALLEDCGEDDGVMEVELACPQKPESGIRLRAQFGRLQTHSEQFMVRPCGIIVARTTFFNSETVPQTVVRYSKRYIRWNIYIYLYRQC